MLDFTVPDFRYYNSVALCALDASFSARANYGGVVNVIESFCENYGFNGRTYETCPRAEEQNKVSEVCRSLQGISPEELAEIVNNRQRIGGRLKAALFLDCLHVFQGFGIETYQYMQNRFDDPHLERAFSALRGIGPATLSYLYMLVGDSNDVKVDRHIRTFATAATGNPDLSGEQIKELFRYAARELANDYPDMTARHLDHIVWEYQRNR